MAPSIPPLIDISSSDEDKDDDLFENEVPPPSAYMKSSSPAVRILPSAPAKRPLPPISKFHSSKAPTQYTELCSSDEDDLLPQGDAIFTHSRTTTVTTKTREVSLGFGIASGSGTSGRDGAGPPPSKKLKVTEPSKHHSKSLSILSTILNNPSTFTDPGAPLQQPARRSVSAPSALAATAFEEIDEDDDEIEEFTDGIRSEDMEIDVWEERQKQKERERKGKGKEVNIGAGGGDVFGAGGTVAGKGKGKEKAPPKKRGKTEEEKAEALAETARKKAEKASEREQAKTAKAAEKLRLSLTKDVNKLRGSKTETFKELLIDISSSSRDSPAFSTLLPSFRDQVEARDSSISWFDSLLDIDPSLPPTNNTNTNPSQQDPRPPNSRRYTPPTILKFRRRLTARYSENLKAWVAFEPRGTTQLVPETTVVVYLTAHELVDHLTVDPATKKRATLLEFPTRVRRSLNLGPRSTVILIVQGLVALYKVKETMAKRAFEQRVREGMGRAGTNHGGVRAKEGWEKELGKGEIEKELVRLQVSEKCFVTHAESDEDVLDALISTIGDLAVKPYRLIDRAHLTFAPHNIKGKNPTDTFCKMIEHLPRVTPAVSQTVQDAHGTWRGLMEMYDALEEDEGGGERAARGLLSDLRVGRTKLGVPNERKVGVALSARVHSVIRQEDDLILVGST